MSYTTRGGVRWLKSGVGREALNNFVAAGYVSESVSEVILLTLFNTTLKLAFVVERKLA